jgi:hypothetical protein
VRKGPHVIINFLLVRFEISVGDAKFFWVGLREDVELVFKIGGEIFVCFQHFFGGLDTIIIIY